MWLVFFDLDQTLICAAHELGRLSETQKKNLNQSISFQVKSPTSKKGIVEITTHPLYQIPHYIFFKELSKKEDHLLFFMTAATYQPSSITQMIKSFFSISDQDLSSYFEKSNIINREMLTYFYKERRKNTKKTVALKKKEMMLYWIELFEDPHEAVSTLASNQTTFLIDDNLDNLLAAENSSINYIDSTKAAYQQYLKILLSKIP
ncbi:hypothetical protein [Pelagibaculum spongiae]|uniref:FCP1 homology domain-containing protein n=1 Tax=Pelagibaculum spongiae TaxID=2080658 RepID=A0A2V1H264_9GAMM|nr:hypothetical protein [Pelagibaculum spongiae]PVZ70532.1 hypothetical protein DC094_08095 [Pelagibaculum spongiae]